MRTILLATIIAFSLAHAAHAGRTPEAAFDPVHNPNFTEAEQNVRLGVFAMGSTLEQKCTNVPWQYSSAFGKSLVAWSRTQGISQERLRYLFDSLKTLDRFLPCEEIPVTMRTISKNWSH